MDWWQALVLGLVEGLTEYLPVSSTGHLLLAQRLLGIDESAASNAYAICIQGGAIVAVLGLYRRRAGEVLRGLAGRSAEGRRLALHLAAAFLPAAVVGLAFDDAIEERLFGLWPITVAWALGGLALLLVPRGGRPRSEEAARGLEQLTPPRALAIGLLQCLAMWPGTSRSLVTILGGVLVGLRLSAAVEFSFLLGAVTLLAATAYEGVKEGEVMLTEYGWGVLLLGFVVAWVAAAASVKWMVAWLQSHGLALFGWYRLLLAAIVGGLLAAGVLAA